MPSVPTLLRKRVHITFDLWQLKKKGWYSVQIKNSRFTK